MPSLRDNPTISFLRSTALSALITTSPVVGSLPPYSTPDMVSEQITDIIDLGISVSQSNFASRSIEGSTALGVSWAEKDGEVEYDTVILRISELFNEQDEEDDEYGASIPTAYARDEALSLLTQTYELVRNFFPRAAVSTSFDGGIRIQWMRPQANVRLIIPDQENGQKYIYFESGNDYGTEDASPHNLADRLFWLRRASQNA